MVDLNERLEKEKKLLLQEEINKIKRDFLPILKKKRENIRIQTQRYQAKIQQIREDMEGEHRARQADLTRIKNKRLKNLASIREEGLAKFENYSQKINKEINFFVKRISENEDAIETGDITTEMLARTRIPLPEIGNTIQLPDPPIFLPGDATSIGGILGKLHVKPPPLVSEPLKPTLLTMVLMFTCPLQGSLSICTTKEGDVWLGGYGSRELLMVDIKGQVTRREKIQSRPAALAVMECGDIIVSPNCEDSKSVSRLTKNGKEKHIYDASPSYCNGVSVTVDQKILICTGDGRVVKIDGDGTNVKQIYKGSGSDSAVHAVENANGNIYISDFAHSAVVRVTSYGKVQSIAHTAEGQKLGRPWGLVVDKMDNILCADIDRHCVYIIDQQIREMAGCFDRIQEPGWLAVDNDNNLWIAQGNEDVQVAKYLSP
ncbi:hypothetical protein FSP39_020398 [Pinctada imbricata]|uniref:Uncharacterized protein n=1 Tax=Pinctada imbricata TaxID=66713 RepID=A0AA88Y460_PINIB|nr:hypothetical protein FSP39_020398 [Pinctada imbricata]